MTVRATGGFGFLRYEPGNPEFPVLPDGVIIPHVMVWGGAGGLAARLITSRRILGSAPAADEQRLSGWQTDTTWVNPAIIDFGVIPSPVRRTISLYNTRTTAVTVTAITVAAGADLTIVTPLLPQTLEPFDGITFTIEAGTNGDPDFDEIVTFTTSAGDSTFRVLGRRVFSLDVLPEAPMSETLQFKTQIIRSTNGTEKAYGLAQSPLSTLDYNVRFEDDLERIRFRNRFLGGDSTLVVGVQKWWEARRITTAALSTDLTIQVPTANASFVVDKPASIFLPDGTVVPMTVDSFDSSSITLSKEVGTAIPLGSLVMPVGLGYVSKFPGYRTYAVNLEDSSFKVVLNQEPDLGVLPGSIPTLGGTPIIEFPNLLKGRTKEGQMNRKEDALNSGVTNRIAFNRFPLGEDVQAFDVLLKSAAEIWEWRGFLHYLRGSYAEIYVPTFNSDLPGVTTAASNVFNVADTDLALLFGDPPVDPRGALRFEYADGTILYRTITDIVDNGATEQLTVSSAVNAGTPKISILQRARILGDTATFIFARPDLATLAFRYRTILV